MTSSSKQLESVIKVFALAAALLGCVLALKRWQGTEIPGEATVFEPNIPVIQAEPLCPWREPQEDLKALFPTATRYERETHILSGLRTQLSTQLGREPTGDENALVVNRIYDDRNTPLGSVLTRRVKGTYGAIELVLGVGPDAKVTGLRLQRHREMGRVGKVLQEPNWLASFVARTAESSWAPDEALASIPAEARPSAEAIIEGTRSMLILLAAAEASSQTVAHKGH